MTHEELRDRLLDLAYGELPPREARHVEEHAAGCEACRAELARIRGTRQLMSALPVEPAPRSGESILVAAAREAVRGKEPRRILPRWLWATPVVAASVAAAIAISLRLGDVRPASVREDPNALLGPSTYAQAPAAAPQDAAAGAEAAGGEAGGRKGDVAEGRDLADAGAAREASRAEREERAERAARTEKKKSASPPARREAESRYATPPTAEGPAADRAPEAFAAAPARPSPAPATPPPAASAAPPSSAGGAAARPMQPPMAGLRAAPEGKSEAQAAPAPRAKAMAAPEASRDEAAPVAARSGRERAVAAATAHAARLSYDTRGNSVDVGPAPVEWDRWSSEHPEDRGLQAPAALEGRMFWVVRFRPTGLVKGGDLTVFVEDVTFRPLADFRGK